ncbi:MAG TPA: hypothetical protein VKV17_22885 [Bryobacteraceae bacterium]|nr:hypothetical protein [Bryobacteraceae bacterium]
MRPRRARSADTIRGTLAQGRVGPDLTHVGSRHTLAAGTLNNNTANLEAWIIRRGLLGSSRRQ